MRLFPKDTFINGEHVDHEPSVFQFLKARNLTYKYVPHIIIGGTILYTMVYIFLIKIVPNL